jgi:carotenoid cleavage dioxygenase-like enzyme
MPDTTSQKSVEPHPQSATQPWWMKGAFRPVTEESTGIDLAFTGELPPDLNGRLLRIGPNPPTGRSPHWFLGAGMVHEIELCNGTAKAYRNRYIKTDYFEAVSNGRPPSLGDPSTDSAQWESVNGRALRLQGRTQDQHDCTPKDMPQNR